MGFMAPRRLRMMQKREELLHVLEERREESEREKKAKTLRTFYINCQNSCMLIGLQVAIVCKSTDTKNDIRCNEHALSEWIWFGYFLELLKFTLYFCDTLLCRRFIVQHFSVMLTVLHVNFLFFFFY